MMNHRPTVILPTLEDVHFIAAARPVKAAGPVLGFPQQISARLKIDPLRVAIAVCPNLWPRILLSNEWIVARHGSIVIQSQRLSRQRIQLLSQLSIGRIAGRDIKLGVGAKS